MNTYITLDNIRLYAFHGVGRQENLVGNEYTLNLRIKADFSRALETDDVADTINYAEIYEAVKEEMAIPSRLLEHAAGRIVRRLMNDFPSIEAIELKLAKRNPPMGADIQSAGVEVHVVRKEN